MSRRVSSQKSTANSKFYCKVCFDAGKFDGEYLSHNVRTPKGQVCCPTILNNKCGRCKKIGHFASRCTVNIDVTYKDTVKIGVKDTVKDTVKVVVTNAFAELDDSTEESPCTPRIKKTPEQTACPWAPVKKNPAEHICPTTAPKKQPKSWADYDSDDE